MQQIQRDLGHLDIFRSYSLKDPNDANDANVARNFTL
jgi:hypothetical protein